MFVISVIPIARGISLDSLSYFSKDPIDEGSVVSIPLRSKNAHGLVVSCVSVKDAKAEVKSADFEMRKITGGGKKMFTLSFMKTTREVAEHHASSIGSVIYDLVPKALLSHPETTPEVIESAYVAATHQSFVLQEPDEDRYAHYKGIIRERFARKQSILIILPTIEDVERAKEKLEKGIESYTYTLHSGKTQKELASVWQKALLDTHSVLILTTGTFISIPRKDLSIIIIDRENARGWKGQSRPFVDVRYCAERLARNLGTDFLIGDSCLRVETLKRHDDGDLVEFAPLSMRSLSTADDTVVDMRTYKPKEKGYRILSDELQDLVRYTRESNSLLFIFSARKGVATSTVCGDCESLFSCERCGATMVLYGKDDSRFFLCNRCGLRADAHVRCKTCGSWKLKTLGVGSESIEDELLETFPDIKVWRLDSTTATTHKKAKTIVDKWLSSPGSVLVGTEMAIPYASRKVENVAIASIDSYFVIPDFRMNERAFVTIARLRSLATKHFLLQTRKPDEPVIIYGRKGNMIDFYREELEIRKKLSFPPFSTIIKTTAVGNKDSVSSEIAMIKKELPDAEVDIFPAFVSMGGNTVGLSAIIRTKEPWPNHKTTSLLRSLSLSTIVNVDPESML